MHNCELPKSMLYNRQELRPCAPRSEKLIAKLHNICSIWEHHYLTKTLFRSMYSLNQESRRYSQSDYWYIVHPLSKASFIKDVFYLILWTFALYFESYVSAFLKKSMNIESIAHTSVTIIIDVLLLINCMLTFFCGYVDNRTREIVLKPSSIACKYAKTYLIVDLLGCLPVYIIYQKIIGKNLNDNLAHITFLDHIARWYRMIRLPRIFTVAKYIYGYSRNKSENLTFSVVILIMFLGSYLVHVYGCIIYYTSVNSVQTIEHPLVEKWLSYNSLLKRYFSAQYVSLTMFTNSAYLIMFTNVVETTLGILIFLTGWIFKLLAIASIYAALVSKEAGAIKYESLINEIDSFAKIEHLKPAMKRRLLYYYQRVFFGEFYDVNTIQETLSYNLHRKLYYRECKHILHTFPSLRGMPMGTAEKIILNSSKKYYLPGDVILKYGDQLKSILFLMYGSVALLYANGLEHNVHLQDGEIFGETIQLTKSMFGASLIAVDFTEVLEVPLILFDHICEEDVNFKNRIEMKAATKYRWFARNQQLESTKNTIENNLEHKKLRVS